MRGYIPTRDTDLGHWVRNFATLIAASPATYGLVTGDADAITALVDDFTGLLEAAIDPSTRTRASVSAKDTAKVAMLEVLRPYAQRIKNNSGVLDDDKIALGLTIRDGIPTPITVPVTSPILNIVRADPRQHTLRFADSETPDRRSKPFGAAGVELFLSIGTAEPANIEVGPYHGLVTRNPHYVQFDAQDVGKTAFYAGRWVTRTGLKGPLSPTISFTIAG